MKFMGCLHKYLWIVRGSYYDVVRISAIQEPEIYLFGGFMDFNMLQTFPIFKSNWIWVESIVIILP